MDNAMSQAESLQLLGDKNPRGIPAVVFIEDVEAFLAKPTSPPVEGVIGAVQELYSKYKFMEVHLLKTKAKTKGKIPDIESTLSMVTHLMERSESGEDMATHFNLCDNVYAKAVIKPSNNRVCLWLGANVMLEYSYEEGISMLTKNKDQATLKLKEVNEDLEFLRDQIITSEVNIARIFNYDVRRRRQEKDAETMAKLAQ